MDAERSEGAERELRALLAELLGVTPLQFRLFREGRTLEEVELEGEEEARLRAEALRDLRDGDAAGCDAAAAAAAALDREEGEDDGAAERPAAAVQVPRESEEELTSLREALLDADLEIRPGGLFAPGMRLEDLHALVAADERWKGCPEEVRAAVFEDMAAGVIAEREAADAALRARLEPRVGAWLAQQALQPGAEWDVVAATRQGLLAKAPERIVRTFFDAHVSQLTAEQVRAWMGVSAAQVQTWHEG